MTPEDRDRAVPLAVPPPDAENPLPIVLAKDGTVVLSYMAFVARKDAHIIVSFHVAFAHRFGPPDRRGLAAHPLAARGLKPDGAFEVKDSSWSREFPGGKGRHYVFAFRDGVFECLAEGYGSETIDEDDDAVRLMARRLYK
ncbi:MAG TPA: hypothetical protein VH309_13530 [Elusimicrobiota bacterium]|nr:hypothetical protein [Elusimicrobiota bacterium]